MKKKVLSLFIFLIGCIAANAGTYYWVGGTTSAAWNTAVWSTTLGGTAVSGFTPTLSDIFIFDGSDISSTAGAQTGNITVSMAASITIAQLIVQNSANATVTSSSANRNVTIAGAAGNDFVVGTGSFLSFTGSTLVVTMNTGTTGTCDGTLVIGSGANDQLIVTDANGMIFTANAVVSHNASSSSTYPFGSGTSASVIFQSGSQFTNVKGNDPFGGTGKSVVTLQPGSTYIYQNASASNFTPDGNIYSNIIYDANVAATISGTSGFTCDNFIVTSSLTSKVMTFSETGTIHIKGNFTLQETSSATITFSPASAASIVFDGALAQTFTHTGTGTFTVGANQTFSVNNPIGVSLGSNLLISAGKFVVTGGSVFNASTFVLSGAGSFSLQADGILKTSNTSGLPASITTTTKTFTAGANYEFNGATVTPFGSLTIGNPKNLKIGASITLDKAISMSGVLSFGNVNSKTLTTAGNLTLLSTTSNTASIADVTNGGTNTGNDISGSITVQRFIQGGASAGTPGRRAFRFLSHPFNTYTDLRQLTNQIDITGTGATASPTLANFTQSGSNAASAFWFDPLSADNGTNDAGWQAFTNSLPASGTDANAWNVGEGIRVLVRGAKGEGLLGGTYVASDVTLSMSGAVNVAASPIVTTLNSNLIAGGGWNLVGNPLPSPVEVQAKLKALRTANIGGANSNIGATAYVWNANKTGTARGGYDAIDLTAASTYSLPMNGVVLVQTTTNNNTALGFSETDKTLTGGTGLFRTTGINNAIALTMFDASGNQLDETFIRFNNKTAATFESNDGGKLLNEYALYSITSDHVKAYINSQPEPSDASRIALGIYSGVAKSFVLKASELDLPTGITVYLKDNFLNVQQAITGVGFEYAFSTTADAASSGANRFELVFAKSVVPVTLASTFTVKLSPNPAIDRVNVNFSNTTKAATTISIVNAAGKTVKTVDAGNTQNGNISIQVKGLAKGSYYVTLNNGTEKKTEKLMIQ